MKFKLLSIFLTLPVLLSAQPKSMVSLTPSEVALAKNIGFSTEILLMLRLKTAAPMQQLFVEDAPIWLGDSVAGESSRFFNGLQLDLPAALADSILWDYSDFFWNKGYHIFRTADNYGLGPDRLGILKTSDPFEAIKIMGTDGLNYGFDHRAVVQVAQKIFQKHPFHVAGVGRTWVEAVLLEQPKDYLEFAQELVRACPDLIGEATPTLPDLAKQMRETGEFYLIWN